MAVGQQVLSGVASLESLRAAEDELGQVVADEGAVHVRKLRRVLALHELYAAEGLALSATPEAARLLRCSQWRADRLLDEGMLLSALPEALDALTTGVLTVEQSSVVVTQLRQVSDLRASDREPEGVDPDPLSDDTRWTLDLTDPYAWTDQPALG